MYYKIDTETPLGESAISFCGESVVEYSLIWKFRELCEVASCVVKVNRIGSHHL